MWFYCIRHLDQNKLLHQLSSPLVAVGHQDIWTVDFRRRIVCYRHPWDCIMSENLLVSLSFGCDPVDIC